MAQDLRTDGPELLPEIPRAPWPVRSLTLAIITAVGVGAAIFCTAFFVERYFHNQGTDPMPMIAASDALAALLGALLILRLSYNFIERRRAIVERLKVIAEVNHHIRNALDLIQLSAQTTADKRAIEVIQEGVDRIEWALREMLCPTGPLGTTWHVKKSSGNTPPPLKEGVPGTSDRIR